MGMIARLIVEVEVEDDYNISELQSLLVEMEDRASRSNFTIYDTDIEIEYT